ncbi:hypothetical protein EVAR_92468_1 [Eumeta japonica]|uniref:Uncharacterized protein n=1 Tax=Eumeta variegata TaxID=151549 RepID=A0A4C1T9F8_EUMVA|nr:hypothetical protein EVAR_92468_1 [Eumeta japonica]
MERGVDHRNSHSLNRTKQKKATTLRPYSHISPAKLEQQIVVLALRLRNTKAPLHYSQLRRKTAEISPVILRTSLKVFVPSRRPGRRNVCPSSRRSRNRLRLVFREAVCSTTCS